MQPVHLQFRFFSGPLAHVAFPKAVGLLLASENVKKPSLHPDLGAMGLPFWKGLPSACLLSVFFFSSLTRFVWRTVQICLLCLLQQITCSSYLKRITALKFSLPLDSVSFERRQNRRSFYRIFVYLIEFFPMNCRNQHSNEKIFILLNKEILSKIIWIKWFLFLWQWPSYCRTVEAVAQEARCMRSHN